MVKFVSWTRLPELAWGRGRGTVSFLWERAFKYVLLEEERGCEHWRSSLIQPWCLLDSGLPVISQYFSPAEKHCEHNRDPSVPKISLWRPPRTSACQEAEFPMPESPWGGTRPIQRAQPLFKIFLEFLLENCSQDYKRKLVSLFWNEPCGQSTVGIVHTGSQAYRFSSQRCSWYSQPTLIFNTITAVQNTCAWTMSQVLSTSPKRLFLYTVHPRTVSWACQREAPYAISMWLILPTSQEPDFPRKQSLDWVSWCRKSRANCEWHHSVGWVPEVDEEPKASWKLAVFSLCAL